MRRREFLKTTPLAIAALGSRGFALEPEHETRIDAAWYSRSRKFADLAISRVAYVERGRGPAALFIHGYPLNGFQWRGALERLHRYRRCIAPDVMGMGHTQTPEGQTISPATQVEMLGLLLDSLHVDTVDLVANDSGGALAQLFVARHPQRVRTLLLTNCDVDANSPPPQFVPFIELAKNHTLIDKVILPQLEDKALARSAKGIGGLAYSYPDKLADETIEAYFRPLVETPLKKLQMQQYATSMATNVLVDVREDLRQWRGPARLVWGMKDELFGVQWAHWLDQTLPGSRGIREVQQANLFFPEEMPGLIAEEASRLWAV